jgi:preprotein translocase subunit Sec63
METFISSCKGDTCCRPHGYEVDEQALEAKFRSLQRQMHPDKHATKGKEVLAIAEQHSARINEGYGVLKCPLARAQYLVISCSRSPVHAGVVMLQCSWCCHEA